MDLIEILKDHGIPYRLHGQHHHTTKGYVQLECFYCSPDWGAFRLGYSQEKGYFSCWSCGGLGLVSTLADLLGISRAEARILTGGLGRGPRTIRKRMGTLKPPSGVGELLPQHRKYLRSRGFDPEEIAGVWKVGGLGFSSRLPWRLYIPICLPDGLQVSWTTRTIADPHPEGLQRYLSASESEEAFPHREILYGTEHTSGGSVVVCEGPVDVWAMGRGAVCTFGLGFTRPQVRLLSQYISRTVLYDSEPMAQKRARELCSLLQAFPGETRLVTLETGKDAAEADKREILEIRRRFLGP